MRVAALFIRTVEMAERPVGQLVVERSRRGTRWLSGRAQHMNRVPPVYRARRRAGCGLSPTGKHSPLRGPRSASDPGRLAGWYYPASTPVRGLVSRCDPTPPAFVGRPKQGAPPCGATMRRRPALPADPVTPALRPGAPATDRRGAPCST